MGKTADPVARVRRFAERHLPTIQAPGVAIGLTSREGPLGVVTVGHANLPAREPVRPEHRFEVRSPSGPATLHHLLTHTAGLPTGRDFTGEGLRELWALCESEVGFAPGTRFHYSNAGYKALGLVLEAIAGQPWWQVVQARVLDPLGMGATEPITTPEGRSRSVSGHVPPFDDRPRHPSHGLVPAPWIESATADGTICYGRGHVYLHSHALVGRHPSPLRAELLPAGPGHHGGSRRSGRALRVRAEDHHRGRAQAHRAHGVDRRVLGMVGDGSGRWCGRHRPDERGRQPRTGSALRPADAVGVVQARAVA